MLMASEKIDKNIGGRLALLTSTYGRGGHLSHVIMIIFTNYLFRIFLRFLLYMGVAAILVM